MVDARRSEAIREGMRQAKMMGKRFGRPQLGPEKELLVRQLLMARWPWRRIVRRLGVGPATIARIAREEKG